MGSSSDWETMRPRPKCSTSWASPTKCEWCRRTARPICCSSTPPAAEGRGLEVIIAGAGGAAHLPGMTAAKTACRCWACRCSRKALNGIDSLLSIVQMPQGRAGGDVRDRRAGAANAALFAAAILACTIRQSRPRSTRFRTRADRAPCWPALTRASRHDRRHRRRRPARPDAGAGGLSARASTSCSWIASPAHPATRSRRRCSASSRTRQLLDELARRCEVVTFDWENVPAGSARTRLATRARIAPPRAGAGHRTGSPAGKDAVPGCASPPTATCAVDSLAELHARGQSTSACRACSRRGAWATTARASACCARRPTSERPGRRWAASPLLYEEFVPFDYEVSVIGVRGLAGEIALYPLNRNLHRDGILRLTRAPWRAAGTGGGSASAHAPGAEHFDYVGVLAIEFFVRRGRTGRQRDGAPRPQLRALDHRRAR